MAGRDLKDLSEQQKQLLTGLLVPVDRGTQGAEAAQAGDGRIGDLRFPECQL